MCAQSGAAPIHLTYVGTELDLFAHATNWKRYLASCVRPYLGVRVLEVGAGIGSNTKLLYTDQTRWVALEPDAKLAQRMHEFEALGNLPCEIEIVTGTLGVLDEVDRFDTVLYVDVLEHVLDDRAELEHAGMHLGRGGSIVVLAPAHQYLYSPFDKAIGHFRRYNRRMLEEMKVAGLRLDTVRYLDSVGLVASLGNRFVLKSSSPSLPQIRFWDRCLVPISRRADPLVRWHFGKSILAVWRKV